MRKAGTSAGGGASVASAISIADAGNLIAAIDVEGALQELAAPLAPDLGVAYYAQLARAFTGVTDRNLAYFGTDFMERAALIAPQTPSGTGAQIPGGNLTTAPGIITCIGPSSGTGLSYFSSAGSGLIVTCNLKTKRWFVVTRMANASGVAPDSHSRMNFALYNGRLLGLGIDGAFSATKYCFFSQASNYNGTVLSTVDLPASGTFSYAWMGSNGTNVKGSFANTSGVHEPEVQIDLAANQINNGASFQFGTLPSGTVAQQDIAACDLIYLWCER